MNNPTSAAAFVAESTEEAGGDESQGVERKSEHESPEPEHGATRLVVQNFFLSFSYVRMIEQRTLGNDRAIGIIVTFSSSNCGPDPREFLLVFRFIRLVYICCIPS